jgi:hypothetical protein
MLRLAAQAPCRSGPVTSTLGRTSEVAQVQAQSKPSLHSRSFCRTLVRPRLAPFPLISTVRATAARQSKGVGRGRYAPALIRCGFSHRKVSRGGRFAPACCAAQSVHGRAACAVPMPLGQRRAGGAVGQRRGKLNVAASSNSALASPLSIGRLFVCQHRQARPNMSVNRSLHGMPPWPRCARCPCCASRPRHHAAPARLPLR